MDSQQKSSLRKTFVFTFGIRFFLLLVLGVFIFLLALNQSNLAKSRDQHFNSYLLADELRQSSDDLTRFARTYVDTTDPKFEKAYWTVLDIRNGKLPRPTNYNQIYWDFHILDNNVTPNEGSAIPLQELMRQEGFTDAEFAQLALAQKNSDNLVKTEMIAMNAIKGIFQDETGAFSINKEPDQLLAIRLMNSKDYYETKANIMKPIDNFYKLFETRTTAAVNKYLLISRILFGVSITLVIIILLLSFYFFKLVNQQIISREKAEAELVNLSKTLEQKVVERTQKLEKSEKILQQSLEETEKINSLMVGRELRMAELKEEIQKLKGLPKV